MRDISLYNLESEYVVGDNNNLLSIIRKINEDSVIFKNIEEDYKKDSIKYGNEYKRANLNFKINLYTYNWLRLKKYFEETLFVEFRLTPDYSKEELKKKGWMIPQQLINIKIQSSGPAQITTEDLYMKYFNNYFDALFVFNIGENNSRIDRYYKQAIFNYKSRNYYSCVVSLFPIIESYHQEINRFNDDCFYRIKNNLSSVTDKIKNVNQIFTTKIDYYNKVVEQFNYLAKNYYFKNSIKRNEEPEIINRNRIMHGVFTREVSQKDCLQLFCVISNLYVIKDIIDSSDSMDILKKEIGELKKEIRE